MQNIEGKSQEYFNYSTDILKWKMFRIYKLFPAYSVSEKWSEYSKISNTFLAQNRLYFLGCIFFWGTKISRALIFPEHLLCQRYAQCKRHDAYTCTCDTCSMALCMCIASYMFKIHLEGKTSSMHAMVHLQTVCNTIICGHRDFLNNIADLSTWRRILVRDCNGWRVIVCCPCWREDWEEQIIDKRMKGKILFLPANR